jgi:hypothetical protein
MKISATGVLALFGIGIVAWLAFKYWPTVKDKLDVTSQTNIVSGPVNALVSDITGVAGDTLGAAINRFFVPVPSINPSVVKSQQIKTCNAVLRDRGTLNGTVCLDLLNQGKLDVTNW